MNLNENYNSQQIIGYCKFACAASESAHACNSCTTSNLLCHPEIEPSLRLQLEASEICSPIDKREIVLGLNKWTFSTIHTPCTFGMYLQRGNTTSLLSRVVRRFLYSYYATAATRHRPGDRSHTLHGHFSPPTRDDEREARRAPVDSKKREQRSIHGTISGSAGCVYSCTKYMGQRPSSAEPGAYSGTDGCTCLRTCAGVPPPIGSSPTPRQRPVR